MKSSIMKIRNSIESLTKRMKLAEDKISGLENKIQELEHSDKNKEKKQYFWDTTETPTL
jgi:predicted  nucleic acid-binding Zn-ribbon protein